MSEVERADKLNLFELIAKVNFALDIDKKKSFKKNRKVVHQDEKRTFYHLPLE